jgi:hypothetical protein
MRSRSPRTRWMPELWTMLSEHRTIASGSRTAILSRNLLAKLLIELGARRRRCLFRICTSVIVSSSEHPALPGPQIRTRRNAHARMPINTAPDAVGGHFSAHRRRPALIS